MWSAKYRLPEMLSQAGGTASPAETEYFQNLAEAAKVLGVP
jgi:hypothetical protein